MDLAVAAWKDLESLFPQRDRVCIAELYHEGDNSNVKSVADVDQ